MRLFREKMALLQYIGLEQKISQALNAKVDLVEEPFLHPYVRKYVIKKLKPFYGKAASTYIKQILDAIILLEFYVAGSDLGIFYKMPKHRTR